MRGRRTEITNLPTTFIFEDSEKTISSMDIEQKAKSLLENILSSEEIELIKNNY